MLSARMRSYTCIKSAATEIAITAGTLTEDSRQEQSRAGLDRCSTDELARLQALISE